MDGQTTEYPIPTDQLSKGSVVSADVIERAFNVRRGTDAFGLAAVQIASYIAKRFADRGEIVTVTQRKHDLVVLTDEEADEHNERQFAAGLRKAARSHHRRMGEDRSQLSPDRLQRHDRGVEVQGRILSAIRKARRDPQIKPAQRATPALVAGKSQKP